ncbi:hypothetical protein K501DRAFT_307499 [Backusella circina FSU 941]|nr:hypothetical protein K501DRAFT_307499 [Backusella circina FSU 941]
MTVSVIIRTYIFDIKDCACLKFLKEFLNSESKSIAERFGLPFRKSFVEYLRSAYPNTKVACLIEQDLHNMNVFTLTNILDVADLPRANSTLDFDLIQFANSLSALSGTNKNPTKLQMEVINYFTYCQKPLVDDLHIEDHKYLKKPGIFPCTKCSKSYKYKHSLKKHMKTAHPEE